MSKNYYREDDDFSELLLGRKIKSAEIREDREGPQYGALTLDNGVRIVLDGESLKSTRHTFPSNTTINSSNERTKMKYSEILALELERALLKEQKIFEKYGEEPTVDGTIIKWESQYRVRGIWYTFAAIKAGGYWYKTCGVSQNKYKFTWNELVDWLEGMIQVRKFKVVYTPKAK